MPKRADLKRVLVIGSGPIVIGQAAEFDYAGTQACRALKEEGIEVILVNSNPATIMTDTDIAERVYIEPLAARFVERIIAAERPDGILPTLGGQTGLNIALELAENGVLGRYAVALLGTPLEAIKKAEDRETFKETMEAIGEPVPPSGIARSLDQALALAEGLGYPVIVRPAYTLGGSGGGIAAGPAELAEIVSRGLRGSIIGQVLLEKSLVGWKEIEYEVLRDGKDNCIIVCNMENLDPVGVHTGDSIVVAPSQTLCDREYQSLRAASLKIIRALGIEGGCNVQFALDPLSQRYYVIEVNPRVSRSSALASKATGYPIAKVAAKVAIGLALDEIINPVTGSTYACFEPALDYVVLKIPRWPFDKFPGADRGLGTQMKATGEVMAIDRSFEGALSKALRSLEGETDSLRYPPASGWDAAALDGRLAVPNDERLYAVAEALRRGWSVSAVSSRTGIDPWFVERIAGMVEMEGKAGTTIDALLLRQAKRLGLPDSLLGELTGLGEDEIRARRVAGGIRPVYKMVDTCAAEFAAGTPYFYSTYEVEDEAVPRPGRKVLVLGSGPIRIGQGIEFDYCSVHAVWGLQEEGYLPVIVNNNPETVSTDFDTAYRLYFEPLTLEDVLAVVEKERPEGVVIQCGGQTAINLAGPLAERGVPILGTPVADIDLAEDREKFHRLLLELRIPAPDGGYVTSPAEAAEVARRIGYPVLVRPSYVLGGRAMEIVHSPEELEEYMASAVRASRRHPVLIDKYLAGTEIEVDAVADGHDVLIPGIMEHIERAGVHSGDSVAVYPARHLDAARVRTVVEYTTRLARALNVRGLLNIQMVVLGGRVYVLEVNPRASRTVPFLSKATGIPLVKLAVKVMVGRSLHDLGYAGGLWPAPGHVAVKAPVFSFGKLRSVDPFLGPEMKSTGEVMGIDYGFPAALHKTMVAAGISLAPPGRILAAIADRDKVEALDLFRDLAGLGYSIFATDATARLLAREGVPVLPVGKNGTDPSALTLLKEGKVDLAIITPTRGKNPDRPGFQLRRAAAEFGVPCLTSLDTARMVLGALATGADGVNGGPVCRPLQEYLARGCI